MVEENRGEMAVMVEDIRLTERCVLCAPILEAGIYGFVVKAIKSSLLKGFEIISPPGSEICEGGNYIGRYA